VGFLKNNKIHIGYSLVNTKAGDVFNREFGLVKAVENSTDAVAFGKINGKEIPHKIKKLLPSFVQRLEKYFKGMRVLVVDTKTAE
jgi:hypothetical protein